jgi:geranylgeranyl pyrophosphate synthase
LDDGGPFKFTRRSPRYAAPGPIRTPIEALAMFGRELGLALQQLDDVGAVLSPRMRAKGDEDIRHDRVTFAWGYAAEHLDAAAFEQLQVALRELRHPSLAQTDRVIDALRSVAEPGARKLVRARLDAAHERLVDRLGPSPAVLRIAAEIEQLEHGYD